MQFQLSEPESYVRLLAVFETDVVYPHIIDTKQDEGRKSYIGGLIIG